MASFADIIKILTMFIKTNFNNSKKVKKNKLCIKTLSLSVFLDITKTADFQGKNDDVSTTQGMCQVIYIFVDPFQVRYNCGKFPDGRICVTDFREGSFCTPILEQSQKGPS